MKLCPKCKKHFSDDANFCPVDAARLLPLEGAAGGDTVSARFDVADKLGGSRTGTVSRATDKQGGKAALKIIAPAVMALPGVAQRIERELKQLERVQSAGVAKIIASGKRGEDTWLAIELLEDAQTLEQAITSRGPIPLDQAAHLIEVVGEALIEAAQVGVVHRDLAPKNILFTGAEIKLINFSLPVPTTEKIPGVPEFVAPEQVEGKAVDQRSNLYSLGALYYYVLTGQFVVSGATPDELHKAHVAASIKPPSQQGATVPAPVEAVIMRALDRSPTKRFLTVRQFVDEVGRIARGEVDLRATAPLGKAGRGNKNELMQTLLGVKTGGAAPAATAPAPVVAAPIASAPTVGSGVPVLAPSPPIAPAPKLPAVTMLDAAPAAPSLPPAVIVSTPPPGLMPNTMIGLASGADPVSAPIPLVDKKKEPEAKKPEAPIQPKPAAQIVEAKPAAQIVEPKAEKSPWASPVAEAAAPAVAAAVAAAPAVAAPVVAPPIVAAPVVSSPKISVAPPAGKKKSAEEKESKGKFRETMWFKKGELDAQAAEKAAEERKSGKEAASDKADSLPIDERYKDDGSITRGDKDKYSLRTGGTQMMAAVKDPKSQNISKVSEDALIGQMKGGRNMIFLFIGIGVLAVGTIIYFVAS